MQCEIDQKTSFILHYKSRSCFDCSWKTHKIAKNVKSGLGRNLKLDLWCVWPQPSGSIQWISVSANRVKQAKRIFFSFKKITISKKQIRFKKNHDKQKIFFRGKKTLQANVFCSIPCTWRILQENFPNKVKTIMQ
jgi:hypothetical protein